MTLLSDFELIRPPYETTQEATIEWLAKAHAEAERRKPSPDPLISEEKLREALSKVGCKPDRISKRGHVVFDYTHYDWDKMEIYRVNEEAEGSQLTRRMRYFEEYVDGIFEQYYPEGKEPPSDLIHVSCTGYVSPSGAQKIASLRNWGDQTTVTHAYHMGCYASLPAIRIARGYLSADRHKRQVDIVHTELCSLHSNPASHKLDQLVSQSLFADGCIKYSVKPEEKGPHFRVMGLHEEILPNSRESMTWKMASWGFEMVLLKEIPVLITRALSPFLKRLGNPTGALFAIHPGGPKILTYAAQELGLDAEQIAHSTQILYEYGNMSSATLPHIWERILKDPAVAEGTFIVSLAFGPGLSITGSVMEKRCGG
jgi:predicted naringenin-chalcone synthase